MLVFDIETNAIDFDLPAPEDSAKTVHCLVIADAATGRTARYNDQGTAQPIAVGVDRLRRADDIGGHNVVRFDIPVLRRLFDFVPQGQVWDSLVLSEMYWGSDLLWKDALRRKKGQRCPPPKLTGRHSLEAWGFRLGEYKNDYAERCKADGVDPWGAWSQSMEDYCEQDVVVNLRLFQMLRQRGVLDLKAARMECELAYHLKMMKSRGWTFDVDAAQQLHARLAGEREVIRQRMVDHFGSFYVRDGKLFEPKRDNSKMGYVAGAQLQKLKLVEFNPGSSDHISTMLMRRYGWKPTKFGDDGKPSTDKDVLAGLSYPPVEDLKQYAKLESVLGLLAEGKQAWLKVARNGRIHATYKQNGTRTGRMSHEKPNIAQVPRVKNFMGAECRSLFTASPGLVMVGGDASGIELRMLAHFTYKYDGGALAEVVLHGDVHTENQRAVGLLERDNAKTFIYAILYGAGDLKLGSIIAADRKEAWSERRMVAAGKQARAAIYARFPGFSQLDERLRELAKKGAIRGIDGRVMTGFSSHKALNTLLQGTAGVLVKAAVPRLPAQLAERGLTLWNDVFLLGHIHDEIQAECAPEHAPLVGESIVAAIRQTGVDYGVRVPLDGEWKSGPTWASTH